MSTNINPIKQIRLDHKLTQKDMASLAGVSPGVVTKTEAGVYPEVPPNLLKAIYTLTGRPTVWAVDEYEAWILEKLSTVKMPKWFPFPENNDPKIMKEFRREVCALNEVPNTIIAFSTLLSIHPYVIEKFEKGRMKEVPKQLVERVTQIWKMQNNKNPSSP